MVDSGPGTVVVPKGPLGLQGYASNAVDLNDYINRAPDPRLNSILSKTNSPLRLGLIQQTDDVAAANGQLWPYATRFMFNPAVINVTYNVATGVLPPNQLTTDQVAAAGIYPGATSIGFSLFFDRTYEVAYGPGQRNPTDLRKIGVYHDIHSLENVVGVSNKGSYTGDQIVGADGKPTGKPEDLLGNMLMIPVYVIFGGGAGVGLAYVGFLTSMNVTYTLFSQNMVPTRATVDLQMTQLIGHGNQDFQRGGGTLIDRAHTAGRTTTSSGKNVPARRNIALPGRSVANS